MGVEKATLSKEGEAAYGRVRGFYIAFLGREPDTVGLRVCVGGRRESVCVRACVCVSACVRMCD